MKDLLSKLPAHFWDVSYNGACYPGAPGITGMNQGANCQLFAYAILRHFRYRPPDFRSSDLWDDTKHTQHVADMEPLDLLLFNRTANPYGAHVALYIGDDHAVHLCRGVGKPVVWPISEFLTQPDYAVFIGAKRFIRDNIPPS